MSVRERAARWVSEIEAQCRPDRVVWCDGSEEERARLTAEAVASGDRKSVV